MDGESLYWPNHKAGKFLNPWRNFQKSPLDVLRFLITPSRFDKRNRASVPCVANDGAELSRPEQSSRIVWVGHATAIIHDGADVVLTDPHFGPRALLPRRVTAPGVPIEAIPPDAIAVLSHNHYDHLDEYSVLRLPASLHWFVPTGLGDWFRARGRQRVTELGWWETASNGAWEISCVPAQHWSRRLGQPLDSTLWCGWYLRSSNYSYYYSGDTGYFHGFREIARKYGSPDVALLPIGAYEPRWFMCYQHMNPADALQAARDLGARNMIPIHWGTFDLADEALDQPPRDLQRALAETAQDQSNPAVQLLAIGEGWHLPPAGDRTATQH